MRWNSARLKGLKLYTLVCNAVHNAAYKRVYAFRAFEVGSGDVKVRFGASFGVAVFVGGIDVSKSLTRLQRVRLGRQAGNRWHQIAEEL